MDDGETRALAPNAALPLGVNLAIDPDEQLATKLPQVLPEKVEAFPHVRDLLRDRRLLGREDQTALTQQAFDYGTTRPHWRLTFGRRRYPRPR